MKRSVCFIFLALLLLSGCSVYYPRPAELPLISSKKDFRLTGGFSLAPGYYGSAAYGLTKSIAVQGSGSYSDDGGPFYLQGSAGYFHDFGNNKILEVYGGYGHGYGRAYKDANPGHLRGYYDIGFVQLNFGKTDISFLNADFGISLKGGLLKSNLYDDSYYLPDHSYGYFNDSGILLEPGAMLRFGWKYFKISLNLSFCYYNKLTNPGFSYPVEFATAGVGLNLVIHPK
jgi:hypothetical protein